MSAQWIRRDVPLFLLIGATVGIAGHQLLLALLGLGVIPAVANTVQAVVTLQLNFVGNSLVTWRRRTAGFEVPVRVPVRVTVIVLEGEGVAVSV